MLVVYVGKPKFEPGKLLSSLLVTFSIVDNRSVRKTPRLWSLGNRGMRISTLISMFLSTPPLKTEYVGALEK